MTLSEELQWRGFVNQTTFKDIRALDKAPIIFYWGVDPSAPSMTIGNLAAAIMVRHFIDHGHQAVLLVGGATGMIGDPDGKAEERNLKTVEELAANKTGLARQYEQVFGGQDFKIVDNYDWFKGINYLDFLRNVGKHVPMRQMLAREFVQSRLGEDGAGISYAEFSYALIQGYDFVYLNREHGVTLQVCGADQWGNSIAGVDLIRRINNTEAHVWSTPLIINRTTGKKFGKTEDGAIWLDSKLTSIYQFYQFWLNIDDEGVADYLKIYTLLSKDAIEAVLAEFSSNRSGRIAQKTLAYEVTKLVHGSSRADSVKLATEVLFGDGDYERLQADDFEMLATELPTVEVRVGDQVSPVLVETGLASSSSEARRFFDQGAIYLNGLQVTSNVAFEAIHDTGSGFAVIRRGKNTTVLARIQQHSN